MSCVRNKRSALIVCCSIASLATLAAGDAVAQGVTPLRVDPTLLGLPPVEKKPKSPAKPEVTPAKPTEAATEKARADVKTVEPQAVEAKPLDAPAVASPATSGSAAPARATAPVESAEKTGATTPATPATVAPAVATSAPGARQAAVLASPPPRTPPSSGTASPSGKVTMLPALRVHPGLLGLPAVAGPAGKAGGAVASVQRPTTVAGIEQGQQDAWRAGQPPVLNFPSETVELPDGAVDSPALRSAKGLAPLTSGGLPRPMFLSADEMAGSADTEMVANGNAEARQAGVVINSDRLTYWPVEDEFEAAGNVRMEQNEDLVTGPRLRMKIASQTGTFDGPTYSFKREAKWATKERERLEKGAQAAAVDPSAQTAWQQAGGFRSSRPEPGSLMNVLGVSAEEPDPIPKTEARGNAERIDFEGENKMRIFNGNYTTCKPDDPGWYVRSDELALDYDREVGEGRNSTVYFQNTPIFWTPWMSFSLNNQRKSGFLAPTFGQSTVSGLMLATPYYWNIAPNMDATISPRVYSKRGLQLATEFRYLDFNYSGRMRGEFLPNDRQGEGKDRYGYSVFHQQNLGQGVTGLLNLSGVSDDKYFTDLSSRSVLSSQRQLLRQGMLTYGGGWWSANIIGQSYQTLNPDPDPKERIAKPYSFAPRIDINARRPDWLGADFAFLGQYTSFTHDAWDQGRRMVAYPQLALPFVQPGWYVTPKIGVHSTSYSLDRRTATADCVDSLGNNHCSGPGGKSSISRTLPIFSLDAGMTFERETTWFGAQATQTLEPRLYYLNVPYKDQREIPNFDTSIADFNFAQIFSENQFLGYDRVSDANQLTAAVVSRLIDPTSGAEAMRAMFGQRYYFQRQRVDLEGKTVPGQSLDKWNRSDFLLAFSGRVLPKTWLDSALQYNPSDARMERSSIGMRYQPELGKVLNASYRFASKEVSSGALKNVDIAGQWPLWGGWSAVGRYNYSILDHKPVETVAGLEYNGGCWAVRLVSHQVATLSGRQNTSFFVQLELNDFARIGSNPVDLLRRNIQGYGLTNQPVADPVFGE